MEKMKITWLGHACFKIEAEGYEIVIDPYEDNSVAGLAPIDTSANEALCSHTHGDHGAAHVVKLAESQIKSPFTVEKFDWYHDDVKGTKRGKNVIHKITYKDTCAVHFGDTGCIPDDELIKQLKNADAVMIPVGGHYTIDAVTAKKIADMLDAKVVIPMHYRSEKFGFPVLAELWEFTKLCDDVKYYSVNFIEVDEKTGKQTAVLSYI